MCVSQVRAQFMDPPSGTRRGMTCTKRSHSSLWYTPRSARGRRSSESKSSWKNRQHEVTIWEREFGC
jgi:hypothetical protein